MTTATHTVLFTPRDQAILLLLSRTPATKQLILRASRTFPGEPFRDERRVRERMHALAHAGLVRAWGATAVGSIQHIYKLTPEGYRRLFDSDAELPHRSFFLEIAPSRFQHTLALAEVIVHTLVAAHEHRIAVSRFHRENELVLQIGDNTQSPDCHVEIVSGGKTFHVLFELDQSTEPVDSVSSNSLRTKVLGYDAYQNMILHNWAALGRPPPRPAFRVAFLMKSVERMHHVLTLAAALACNKDRRLIYAATQDAFLAEPDAVRQPLFLDHFGHWQALVDLHSSSVFLRTPVRLSTAVSRPTVL